MHWYGKAGVSRNRKIGHITIVGPNRAACRQRLAMVAPEAAAALREASPSHEAAASSSRGPRGYEADDESSAGGNEQLRQDIRATQPPAQTGNGLPHGNEIVATDLGIDRSAGTGSPSSTQISGTGARLASSPSSGSLAQVAATMGVRLQHGDDRQQAAELGPAPATPASAGSSTGPGAQAQPSHGGSLPSCWIPSWQRMRDQALHCLEACNVVD